MFRDSRARLLLLIICLSGLIFVALQSTSGERKASAAGGDSLLAHLRPSRTRLTLEVPPGSHLHVRLRDRITNRNRSGDILTGKLDDSVEESGYVVIPRGSRVIGRIMRVGDDTRRPGATQVTLMLEQIVLGKTVVPIDSRTLTLSKPLGVPPPEPDSLFHPGSGFLPDQDATESSVEKNDADTIYEPDTRLTFVLAEHLRLPVFVPSD